MFIIVILSIVQRYPFTARVCVDWVRFSMLWSQSNAEFCQRLPVVLRIHNLSACCRDVYQENSGEMLPKFHVGSGAEHGKTNPIYTYSGGIRTYLYLLVCRLI